MSEAWSQWEGHVVNGEFHLQKFLGGSSESAVFLTEHCGAELQPAAIKLIPAVEATKNLYLSRWSAAEMLSHPHLIRLLQKGCCRLGDADLLFVVMEDAEENLAEIIPERPLTPAEVRDLLKPTLDALSYLHGRGFVHGHLKPANILAAKDQLKLSSDGLFVAGEALASPDKAKPSPYDPPEKMNGTISPAADVWSLGMTLAEALTQRLPRWNAQEQVDPGVPVDLPAPFSDVVRGCLRRDPQQRLTLEELRARLDDKPALAEAHMPLPQPESRLQSPRLPQPQAAKAQPAAPRKLASPKSLVAPALIAVLAVTALLAGLGLLRRQPDAADQKPAARQESQRPEPPATNGAYHPVAGSGEKPSPATTRRQAAVPAATAGPANSAPLLTRVSTDVVHKVLPEVPQNARDTIQGTIRVGIRVQVDSSGNVVGSEVDSPGPSKYFARLAAQAAQGWKFTASNRDAGRDFIVRFDFTNTETRASATQAP